MGKIILTPSEFQDIIIHSKDKSEIYGTGTVFITKNIPKHEGEYFITAHPALSIPLKENTSQDKPVTIALDYYEKMDPKKRNFVKPWQVSPEKTGTIFTDTIELAVDRGSKMDQFVVGAAGRSEGWESFLTVDPTNHQKLIQYFTDIRNQIVNILGEHITQENIFRAPTKEGEMPKINAIHNGNEARIFSLCGPSAIIGEDITAERRRVQATWSELVKLINYYSVINGLGELGDQNHYLDDEKVAEIIETYSSKTR